MRFRAPANVLLRRAQLVLMLATLVPTVLMTALGIVLLATGSRSVSIVAGVLVLAFCTSSVTGYILGSIFVSKGASLARLQHDYLSTVSHELNTPLTSIRMFIDTLQEEEKLTAEEKQKCLALLNQETDRMAGLVARLQELARIETGRHAFARDRLPVSAIVDDAMKAFTTATLPGHVDIDVNVDDGLFVVGDRTALARVLSNLLTNAWKYTSDDDRNISLLARNHGSRFVEISVVDNGAGIPRTEQQQIFQKFERGEQALQSGAPGQGLGLAIVRAIVRAHKGKVEVQSKPGRGSQFRILLRRDEGRATT